MEKLKPYNDKTSQEPNQNHPKSEQKCPKYGYLLSNHKFGSGRCPEIGIEVEQEMEEETKRRLEHFYFKKFEDVDEFCKELNDFVQEAHQAGREEMVEKVKEMRLYQISDTEIIQKLLS